MTSMRLEERRGPLRCEPFFRPPIDPPPRLARPDLQTYKLPSLLASPKLSSLSPLFILFSRSIAMAAVALKRTGQKVCFVPILAYLALTQSRSRARCPSLGKSSPRERKHDR